MANWISFDTFFLADAFGNTRPTRAGVARVGDRVVFALQLDPQNADPGVPPDYTLDLEGLSEMVSTLNTQRRKLISETGGTQ